MYALGASLMMAATGRRAVIYPDHADRPEQRAAIVKGNRRSVNVKGPLRLLIEQMLRRAPSGVPTSRTSSARCRRSRRHGFIPDGNRMPTTRDARATCFWEAAPRKRTTPRGDGTGPLVRLTVPPRAVARDRHARTLPLWAATQVALIVYAIRRYRRSVRVSGA